MFDDGPTDAEIEDMLLAQQIETMDLLWFEELRELEMIENQMIEAADQLWFEELLDANDQTSDGSPCLT